MFRPLIVVAICYVTEVLSQSTLTLSVSSTAPTGVSPTVDPSYPGFAFEERSFYYYFGPGGQPNTFSVNLVNQVASRTNTKPCIRVGGSSLNSATYDPSQSAALDIPPGVIGHGIPLGMTIGPSYFDAFNNVQAQYVLDLPMAPKTDQSQTVALAKQAYSTIGGDNIVELELGNEVNSYGKAYSPSDYATQFKSFSSAVSQALGISTTDPRWQVGSLANAVGPAWNVTSMFTAGLNNVKSQIRSFTVHYYQIITHNLSIKRVMDHGAIVSKMAQFQSEIDYCASIGIAFSMEEVAVGAGNVGGNTDPNERTLGTALWQVDFMLYAMTMGVHRINMQSGLGFDFSLFAGADFNATSGLRPQAVYANYYGQLFVADFISTSGAMQALNLDLGSDSASAYAAYENGKLARVALINLNYWNSADSSSGGSRGSSTFSINYDGNVNDITVQHLSSSLGAGALDSEDISWAGQSWSTNNSGMAYAAATNDSSSVSGSNGVLSVDVPDSEAVLLIFNQASSGSTSSSSSSAVTSGASSTTTVSSTIVSSSAAASGTTSTTVTTPGTSATGSATQSAAIAGSSAGGIRHAATDSTLAWAGMAGAVVAAAVFGV